tara:strand:+ start:603 stop:965 length:363 start_codon:yes stop_codon:yes gene_type:complete
MSYADTIQQILSDGRWHCVLDLIAETGLSARNRISELNKDHEKKYAKKRYIGKKCKLESCKHRSELYMYKLNTGVVSEELVFGDPVIEDMAMNRENEDWNNKTPEERHEYIKNLKKNFGL